MKAQSGGGGTGGTTTRILQLGTRWSWVVYFTFRSLYPQEKVSISRWWRECSRAGLVILLPLLGMDPWFLGRPTVAHSLCWLKPPPPLLVDSTSLNNKTNSIFRQEHNNCIWYWCLTMATFFGLSLDHLQANVHRKKLQFVRSPEDGL